jgi:hypothetical protein
MNPESRDTSYRNPYLVVVSHTLLSLFIAVFLAFIFYNAIELHYLPNTIMRYGAVGAGLVLVSQLGFSALACFRAIRQRMLSILALWVIFMVLQLIMLTMAAYVVQVCFGITGPYTGGIIQL